MEATVDLAARARMPRLVAEIAERAEARREHARTDDEEASRRELKHWLADLERYPRAFRSRLRSHVEVVCSPDYVARGWAGPQMLRESRAHLGASYCQRLHAQLGAYRQSISALRAAQESGDQKALQGAREGLSWYSRNILSLLWEHGRRRILRADLQAVVEHEILNEWRRWDEVASTYPERIETLREKLRVGVVIAGPRCGAPFATTYRAKLERGLQDLESALEYAKSQLVALADPDPLRAAGILPTRRRAKARDEAA